MVELARNGPKWAPNGPDYETMKDTPIEWAHHTFNPWWGCSKVSPACANCYAEAIAHRFGKGVWGPAARRQFQSDRYWEAPERWNRLASDAAARVFVASMGDVFEELPEDHPDSARMEVERRRLWRLIERTPNLRWLILTKLVPLAWQTNSRRPRNAWLGTTAESQRYASARVPHLLQATWPARRFVSYEPALGPLDLRQWLHRIDWVIAGAESGAKRRHLDHEWLRAIRDQCTANSVAFFFKQDFPGQRKVSLPLLDGVRWMEVPDA